MFNIEKKKTRKYFLLLLFIPSLLIFLFNLVFFDSLKYAAFSVFTVDYLFFLFLLPIAAFYYINSSDRRFCDMLSPLAYACLVLYSSPGAVFALVFAASLNAVPLYFEKKLKRYNSIKKGLELVLSLLISIVFYRAFVPESLDFSSGVSLFSCFILGVSALISAFLTDFFRILDDILLNGLNRGYLFKVNFHALLTTLITSFPLSLLIALVVSVDIKAAILLFPIFAIYVSLKNYSEISREAKSAIEDVIDFYERKNSGSFRHSLRVSNIAVSIARELLLPEAQIEKIAFASRIHDAGRIAISAEEGESMSKMTTKELPKLKKYNEYTVKIFGRFVWFKDEADIIKYRHENFDGSGGPYGLKGKEIPIGARILAAAHKCERFFSEKASSSEIVERMRELSGTEFDPEVVAAIERLFLEES